MAYIYLDELKDTLPAIMNDWIDVGDESWEWIFNAIEQNCHIGKHSKGKKWKKKLQSMVDTHSTILSAHRNDINELTERIDELSNKISNLSDRYTVMTTRVNRMDKDIAAAKSMAETAKQRTEVDYSKYSGKSDGEPEIKVEESKQSCETCKYEKYDKAFMKCVACDIYSNWEAKDE